MRATLDANWLILSHGVSITQLRISGPTIEGAPSVLELAESREQFATPQATLQIAEWVNEGGAGGEVRR